MHRHIVAFSVCFGPFSTGTMSPPPLCILGTPGVAAYGPHLHRVESTVAVERETDDVCGVLVPASVDRVAHDISGLWEDLLDEGLLSTECDPLTQVRGDPHHQAVTGPAATPLLLLLLPALQLTHHGLQLVVPCLLIQEVEVLSETTECQGSRQQSILVAHPIPSGAPSLYTDIIIPRTQCGRGRAFPR